MRDMRVTFVGVCLSLAVPLVSLCLSRADAEEMPASQRSDRAEPEAWLFECRDKKWIKVRFFDIPAPHVALELSDGRRLELAQRGAPLGTRYANDTETIEFWNKGVYARLEEGPLGEGKTVTFEECQE